MKRQRLFMSGSVLFAVLAFALFAHAGQAQSISPSSINVNFVTDEADAVLAILAKNTAGQTVTETDWQRLFSSEGYVRLKKRELAMQRPFEDAQFQAFVLSDKLAAVAPALSRTLQQWRQASVNDAARRVLAYLPKDAQIHAKIYPVIKPQENSFVFEINVDPAIFLYLDPTKSREQFENTLAHELHHIGYSSSCPVKQVKDEISKLPPAAQTMLQWVGAFGEGFAMLAAAGGPDVHPHAFSKPEDRARWDHDVANFNDDLRKVEQFFLKVLENKLSEEEISKTGFSFFGVQGPWYTVGWKMSVIIEKTYGRSRLIECICDQRKLLPTYNQAATEYNRKTRASLALWSPAIIEAMRKADHQ